MLIHGVDEIEIKELCIDTAIRSVYVKRINGCLIVDRIRSTYSPMSAALHPILEQYLDSDAIFRDFYPSSNPVLSLSSLSPSLKAVHALLRISNVPAIDTGVPIPNVSLGSQSPLSFYMDLSNAFEH